jgi:hypothetical protein
MPTISSTISRGKRSETVVAVDMRVLIESGLERFMRAALWTNLRLTPTILKTDNLVFEASTELNPFLLALRIKAPL